MGYNERRLQDQTGPAASGATPPPASSPRTGPVAGTRRGQIRVLLIAGLALVATFWLPSLTNGSADAADSRIINETTVSPGGQARGSFRIQCAFSHVSHNDPIVKFGQPGQSHRHYFYGNESVTAFTTANSIRQTGESTCHGGTLNRSGYWMPALLNGAGRPISTEQTHFYYKSGDLRPSEIEAFPQGLRMVSSAAPMGQTPNRNRVRWLCTADASRSDEVGGFTRIPPCKRGRFLQASVLFPQCWDGQNLDSSNHISHMAWPIPVAGSLYGRCPATHPRKLPRVNLNFLFRVTPKTGTTGWRLVSDTPSQAGGRSLHADWMEGWDRNAVNTFVTHCIKAGRNCRSGNLGNNTALRRFRPGVRARGAAGAGAPGAQIAGSAPLLRPKGRFTKVQPAAGGVRVKGFFRDPNSIGPVQVHIFHKLPGQALRDATKVKVVTANLPEVPGFPILRIEPFELHSGNYRLDHFAPIPSGTRDICLWVRDWQLRNQRLVKKGQWVGCKQTVVS